MPRHRALPVLGYVKSNSADYLQPSSSSPRHPLFPGRPDLTLQTQSRRKSPHGPTPRSQTSSQSWTCFRKGWELPQGSLDCCSYHLRFRLRQLARPPVLCPQCPRTPSWTSLIASCCLGGGRDGRCPKGRSLVSCLFSSPHWDVCHCWPGKKKLVLFISILDWDVLYDIITSWLKGMNS